MILSVTFSRPVSNVEEILGKPFEKIKIKIENSGGKTSYFAEMYTQKQVFHKHLSEEELDDFIQLHAGKTFRNCVKRTEAEEITVMASKKGKITTLTKKIDVKAGQNQNPNQNQKSLKILPDRKKNYILEEGNPVPFLVLLGIMTAEGKVISSKYDKFRQINRFLEFVNDILPDLIENKKENEPVRIADFGCGKSYLTFAVHYFLTEIKKIDCEIEGLDLKEDVISYCNDITKKLGLKGLEFKIGNIADYSGKASPDLIVTLHACDTATDFALKYAVERKAKGILSVPCCQHEVNAQLGKNSSVEYNPEFLPLLKWGIIREKFSSLVTDALRGEWLENQGYKVQMLEFIDEEHTPKNILIRAVLKNNGHADNKPELLKELNINPEIWK